MKPINLKIKGLNSFYDEQIIDFRKLIDRGIFGIFGPTGSGKSTIIDAITIALYGEISRYDETIKGDREFINTNSDNMTVHFEFEINSSGEKNTYVVEREYKKKNDSTIRATTARLYKQKGDTFDILADKPKEVSNEVEKIVGLTYYDFTRAVILPQGKFSRFLMLANKERRDMLERIFALEKYGENLSSLIWEKKNSQKNLVDKIKDELELYGDISNEKIMSEKQNYINQTNEISNLNKELKDKDTLLFKYQNLVKFKDEYLTYCNKQQEMSKVSNDIDNKINILSRAKKADIVFPYIKGLEETENKLQKNQKLLINYLEHCNKIEENLEIKRKQYEEAFSIKEINYPILLEKQMKLRNALELQKELFDEKEELNKLNDSYNIYVKNLSSLDINFQKEKELIDIMNNQLSIILKEKNKIDIDMEYKNDIEQAYNTEIKYNETVLEMNNEKESLILKSENIKQSKEKLNIIDDELIKLNEKYNIISEKLKNIIESYPDSNDELIKLKEIIINKENLLALNMDKRNKLKEKIEKSENYEIAIKNDKQKYEVIYKEILSLQNSIKDTENQLQVFENENIIMLLASKLEDNKPCPVCGSNNHPQPFKRAVNNLSNELYEKKDKLIEDKNSLEQKKQEIYVKILSQEKMYDNINMEISNIRDELKSFDIEAEKKDITSKKESFEALKNKIEQWKIEKSESEKEISYYKDKMQELNINEMSLKKEISKDIEAVNDLNNKIEKLEKKKYELQGILNTYISKYESADFENKYKKMKEDEHKRYELDKNQSILQLQINEKNNLIIKLKEDINKFEKNIENSSNIINEKNKNIEKLNEKIQDLSNGDNIEQAISEVNNEILKITENENNLKKALEEATKVRQTSVQQKMNLIKEKETFEQLKAEYDEKLKSSLMENKFDSIDDVKSYFLNNDKQQIIENEINKYNDLKKEIQNNIDRLKKSLKGENIEKLDEKFICLKDEIEKLKYTINDKNKEIAFLSFRITEMEKNILKFEELKSKLQKEQKKYDLLHDLAELTKGNKFVEFIAVNQLKYITHEASSRLKDMSNGRYALELDGANFIIRDDFNGGTRRTPKTLSGGETFLVSLSLALALSTKIQLKNKAPLEIFFLDEGFGTLDSELLDTVMNCLERLHMEKINVGIITHIEELKNRVQSRLIITPPYGSHKGSKITIE